MRKVWVIEQGEYSDYRVVGVFSSRENAEIVAKAIGGDGATIAEWILDPVVKDLQSGRENYLIIMLRDGSVERCEPWPFSGYDVGRGLSIWRRSQAPAYKGQGIQDCLNGTVFAKNAKHAAKIANEQRAQLIASGEWA